MWRGKEISYVEKSQHVTLDPHILTQELKGTDQTSSRQDFDLRNPFHLTFMTPARAIHFCRFLSCLRFTKIQMRNIILSFLTVYFNIIGLRINDNTKNIEKLNQYFLFASTLFPRGRNSAFTPGCRKRITISSRKRIRGPLSENFLTPSRGYLADICRQIYINLNNDFMTMRAYLT